MLQNMSVDISEHPGIISWDNIDKRWIYFEKFLRGPALTKFINTIIYCKEITKEVSGNQWNIGEADNDS